MAYVTTESGRLAAEYDRDLVERFLKGDESAFAEIVSRYESKLFTISLGFLKDRGDAEEITQDTFIRAHRGLKNFRGDSSLATWLYRIVANLSRNRYWYHDRRKRGMSTSIDMHVSQETELTIGDCIASEDQSPSQEVVVNEFESVLSVCMQNLSWKHREALEMRIFDHRSYEYIGEALYLNTGTVKSRLARARGMLLSLIAQTYPDFAGDDVARMLRGNRVRTAINQA